MGADSLASARAIRQPIESTHDISNAFDGITYSKGGAVLAMFERWRRAPRSSATACGSTCATHACGNATRDDLVAALGRGRAARTWPRRCAPSSTSPACRSRGRAQCDERTAKAEVALTQSRYLPVGSTGSRGQRWQVPVCLRYQLRGQADEACTLLTSRPRRVPLESAGLPRLG